MATPATSQKQAAQAAPSVSNLTLELDSKSDRISGGAVYRIPGRKGLVYFPVSLFEGPVPANITVTGIKVAAPKVAAAKLTPEERAKLVAQRKAERAKETPVQKAARLKAHAEKLAANAQKRAAEAAKLAAAASVSA